MSKLPAFQFYPSDWRSDPGIQSLSFEDRGIWWEIVCLMHESPRRGVLLMPNGAPMMSVSLARILGLPTPKMVKALDRIAAAGVSDREAETGALVNRRMVRDEALRQVRTEAGRLGGNPNLVKQNPTSVDNQPAKQKSTPSSSSSSSSSTSNLNPEEPPLSPPAKPKQPARRKTAPPDEMEITDRMWEWASENGFSSVDVRRETPAMLDHFRGSGVMKLDWEATWRNWMRNNRSGKYSRSKGNAEESREQAKVRRNLEAAGFAAPEVHGDFGGGLGSGDYTGEGDALPAPTLRPRRITDQAGF